MAESAEILEAGRRLRAGGLVAFATETVYGLGANALDAEAVAKVFAAKARPSFDPLIVHVASAAAAWELVDLDRVSEAVRQFPEALARVFWPGPLTLVLPKKFLIPGIVTSGLDTVGVRVPRHPVAQRLLAAAGVPIAAPSANIFGGISPTRAGHVTVDCDMVLDGGRCTTGVESTVVGFAGGTPEGRSTETSQRASAANVVVLRLGGTSVEAIEQVVGGEVTVAKPGEKIASPGMLDRHYAPRTPMRLVPSLKELDPTVFKGQRVGLLSFLGEPSRTLEFAVTEILSSTGDLTAAAGRLFDAMHRLDAAGLDLIVAERVPERDLGRAINDRLRRAAGRP